MVYIPNKVRVLTSASAWTTALVRVYIPNKVEVVTSCGWVVRVYT